MHEELKGEGREAESGREIFILSSDGVRWPFGTMRTDDNPCDRATACRGRRRQPSPDRTRHT